MQAARPTWRWRRPRGQRYLIVFKFESTSATWRDSGFVLGQTATEPLSKYSALTRLTPERHECNDFKAALRLAARSELRAPTPVRTRTYLLRSKCWLVASEKARRREGPLSVVESEPEKAGALSVDVPRRDCRERVLVNY